jgi:hypothetical protein
MVLYELLTGVLPFDSRGLLPAAFIAQYVLGKADIPKPSNRVAMLESDTANNSAKRRHTTPVGLRRELRGDIDWIVVKAIERDRNRRYETVNRGSPATCAATVAPTLGRLPAKLNARLPPVRVLIPLLRFSSKPNRGAKGHNKPFVLAHS